MLGERGDDLDPRLRHADRRVADRSRWPALPVGAQSGTERAAPSFACRRRLVRRRPACAVSSVERGEDAVVERLEVGDHLADLASGSRLRLPAHRSRAAGAPRTSSTLIPAEREGLAQLAVVGDLGDEAVARRAWSAPPGRAGPPHSLVSRAAAWELSAVASRCERLVVERVQRLRVQPLGVLVQHAPRAARTWRSAPAARRGCPRRRRRSSGPRRGRPRRACAQRARARTSLRAACSRSKRSRLASSRSRVPPEPGQARTISPAVHRLAHPVGALALAEQRR